YRRPPPAIDTRAPVRGEPVIARGITLPGDPATQIAVRQLQAHVRSPFHHARPVIPSSGAPMRDPRPARRRRSGRKLLLSVAAVAAAASIAGLPTFATFTSSVSQSQSISTGTVTISLGATGASTNRLNVGATAVAPGDTIQRSVDL